MKILVWLAGLVSLVGVVVGLGMTLAGSASGLGVYWVVSGLAGTLLWWSVYGIWDGIERLRGEVREVRELLAQSRKLEK